MDTTYDVFVSHNGLDKPVVERLCWALLEAGLRPWFDKWDLAPGDVWMAVVERVLATVPAVIVCVGEHGLSAWHDAERQAALDRSTASGAGTVVPVLLPGAPTTVELPIFLRGRQAVDLRAEPAWDDGIARLAEALTGRATPRGPWVEEARERPYRGLRPFTEADAGWMFGREREERELLDALREGQRFVTVVGASGSGKSSLVRAGVVPAVRTGAFDGRQRWHALVMRPGAQPCHALAVRLVELQRSVEGSATDVAAEGQRLDELRTRLSTSERALADVADLLLDRNARDEQLLLVVDQFEELFTESAGAAPEAGTTLAPEAAALLSNLLHATALEGGRVRVILTLRADFTGDCLAVPELGRRMARMNFALPPMTAEQLRDAIRRPALRMGYDVEKPLVDVLVAATVDQAGRLPLLQHTLDLLWDVRDRQRRRLTYAAYDERVGSIDASVATRAESVFEVLVKQAPDREAVVRRVFLRLVHLVEGTRHTRRRLRQSELEGDPAALAVLEAFVDARLVVTDEHREHADEPPEQMAEIAHEALIGRWSRLRRWLDESREVLRMRQEIELDAEQWQQRGRPTDELWRGARLAHAWETLAQEGTDLSPDERSFLAAAKAAESAEQQAETRRQRRQLTAATGASVVLLLSLGVALAQYVDAKRLAKHNADLAAEKAEETERVKDGARQLEAERRAARALARAEQSARASLLAAVPGQELAALELAVRTVGEELGEGGNPPPQLANGLHDALVHARRVVVLRGHTDTVPWMVWSPDGKRLATGSDDHTVRLWNVETGAPLAPLEGHSGVITGLVWSPDGTRLVSTSDDETVRLWDGRTGAPLATLQGHVGEIVEVAWSLDGSRLATLGTRSMAPAYWDRVEGEPKLWDGRTGALLATLEGHWGSAVNLAWSPDGSRLATVHADTTTRLWDGSTGARLSVLQGHTLPVVDVAWSPDGTRLATASLDETARLWDPATGEAKATFRGHTGGVLMLEWSSDGARLATASKDKTARLWDAESGAALATLHGHAFDIIGLLWAPNGSYLATIGHRSGPVMDLSQGEARIWGRLGESLANLQGHTGPLMAWEWSPDGTRLATASWDQTTRIWDAATGEALAVLEGHEGGVLTLAWSPDGSRLATAGVDATVRLWDTITAEQLATLRGHQLALFELAWSPDGARLATASQDGAVKVWDRGATTAAVTLEHTNWVVDVAWSPDGKRLATANEDPTARIWDPATGQESAALRGHTNKVVAVAWSPDGKQLATGSADQTVKLWSADTQRNLATLRGHTDTVWSLAWAPDGTRLATASADQTAKLWDITTGKELTTLRGHTDSVSLVAWAPDGTRVVTASTTGDDNTARLWSADTGQALATLGEKVSAVAWAPDGTRLATAGPDGTVRLWDATTATPRATHQGSAEIVTDLEWAPDGSRFATTGYDYTVTQWDGTTGERLASLRGHAHVIDALAWSPDGKTLASASKDKTARLWPGALNGWLARACEILEGSTGAIHLQPETKALCAAQRTPPSP